MASAEEMKRSGLVVRSHGEGRGPQVPIADRRSGGRSRPAGDDAKGAKNAIAAERGTSSPGFKKNAAVVDVVRKSLEKRGSFFHDAATAYIFLNDTRVLLPIEPDELGLELLLHDYGLFPTEPLTRQVIDGLRLHAHSRGAAIDVHPYAYYNAAAYTSYVYDFAGGVYRIRPDVVDHVDNGTDGVLFVQNPRWRELRLAAIGNETDWASWLIEGLQFGNGILTHDDQKCLLTLWILSLFVPQLFPTRVILALLGDKGSGKSSLLRRLGKLMFGPKFNVAMLTSKPDDFDAAITSEPLVVADNADQAPNWFPDKLAVVATGGTVKRRVLYTTNRLVEYPIVANLAVTSRTPNFKREDVAERLLPLTVTRIEAFQPESALLTAVESRREEMIGAILGDVQRVLRELQMAGSRTHRTKFRMADFADFAIKAANVVSTEADVRAILDRVTDQQVALATEDQPLVELLDRWLEQDEAEHVNVWREITLQELREELEKLAGSMALPWSRGNQKSFGQHVRTMKGTLSTMYGMHERVGHGGKTIVTFDHWRGGAVGDFVESNASRTWEQESDRLEDFEDEGTQVTVRR